MNADRKALVLFSGGQDSTACLAWALEHFAQVETAGFDYGQRHVVELSVRARIRERMAALKPDWKKRLCDAYRHFAGGNRRWLLRRRCERDQRFD